MDKIIKYFYLTPKDLGIQTFDTEQIIELMKDDSHVDINDGPIKFASAVHDIFESKSN